MYKILVKKSNPAGRWGPMGTYGSENAALSRAYRLTKQYIMVKVVDRNGKTVWSH
jgi:hypothetical protein